MRKKFLKTEQTEFQAIDTLVRRFALSAPHITITLNHNGKPMLSLPSATEKVTQQARIGRIMGKQFIENANYIDAKHTDLTLYGWVSGIHYQRNQNDKLWIYINGRMVKDKLINHAIKQAYEAILHPGKHPACVLYLVIAPQEIDVNVHPTKHEIRFQQPRLVHDFINTQLRHALKLPNPALSNEFIKQWPMLSLPITKTCLQVKENNSSFWPIEREEETEPLQWLMVISKRFALAYLTQKSYLVDLAKLQQYWLKYSLQNASLPLEARSLLVPVYIDSLDLDFEDLQCARDLLAKVGIDIHLNKNKKIIIHSLPELIPNLTIKAFFNAFFALPYCNLDHLFTLLITYHGQEDIPITQEQRRNYLSYLRAQFSTIEGEQFIKYLSEDVCQSLLNAN